jgi:hypothetical protein
VVVISAQGKISKAVRKLTGLSTFLWEVSLDDPSRRQRQSAMGKMGREKRPSDFETC